MNDFEADGEGVAGPEAGRARVSSVLLGLVVLAIVVVLPLTLFLAPERFFSVDSDAVANSIDDELSDGRTTFGCQDPRPNVWRCTVRGSGSAASGSIVVRLDDDRCWRELPAPGREQLHACLSLTDYVINNG